MKVASVQCNIIVNRYYYHSSFFILGTLTVTNMSCSCKFANTMHLLYRHVFTVCDKLGLPLYSESGIVDRWKLSLGPKRMLQHSNVHSFI